MLLVFTIVTFYVTEYVPTGIWINYLGSDHSRVDNDNVVQFLNLVVTSMASKIFSNILPKCTKIFLKHYSIITAKLVSHTL